MLTGSCIIDVIQSDSVGFYRGSFDLRERALDGCFLCCFLPIRLASALVRNCKHIRENGFHVKKNPTSTRVYLEDVERLFFDFQTF